MELAKQNIERYYPVVGVLEHMNETLTVLEHYWPKYFKGALYAYHNVKEVTDFRMPNPYKLPVSEEVRSLVKANFTREYEFYEFCKQRLIRQYREIVNLKNSD